MKFITAYKNSPLYAMNTRAVGATAVTVGTATAFTVFANLLGNHDFLTALLHHDRVAEVSLGLAFAVGILSLLAAWVGRNPKIPDDPAMVKPPGG